MMAITCYIIAAFSLPQTLTWCIFHRLNQLSNTPHSLLFITRNLHTSPLSRRPTATAPCANWYFAISLIWCFVIWSVGLSCKMSDCEIHLMRQAGRQLMETSEALMAICSKGLKQHCFRISVSQSASSKWFHENLLEKIEILRQYSASWCIWNNPGE